MKKPLFYVLFWLISMISIQAQDTLHLGFKEYLGYVKKFHPIAKQGMLAIEIGQANLMKARGGFDPKLEVDYARKEFKGTEYYNRLNATFKIPTWYGIELKTNFDKNNGFYLNPEGTVPPEGLYSAGVSVSLGRDSWINERMATLKRAKLFKERSMADLDLLVNQVLYEAAIAYFDWIRAYKEVEVYREFLANAKKRFEGTKRMAQTGEIAAIDTVEARITVQNRNLDLTKSRVRFNNQALKVSNFLWIGDQIPVELQPNVIPNIHVEAEIQSTFEINGLPLTSFNIEDHPKIRSLGYKIEGIQVEKNLKMNRLLPLINLEFNLLTETPEQINSFAPQQYKGGFNFQFPIFLRKERGDLQLTKIKLQDAKYEIDNAEIEIRNKVLAIYNELDSFQYQNELIEGIVKDYAILLKGEERKFGFGESSLFLINTRENKLIDASLKRIEVQNKFFTTQAKLFKSLAVNPRNL